jgi:hypothetical protein
MLLQQRGNKHLGVEGAHYELNLGHHYGNCFELPLVMVQTLRPIIIMKTYQWFQLQLYCATILQLYSQILVSGQMQLYVTIVDTQRGVNQYQVQFKTFFNLYLNHSIISNEK